MRALHMADVRPAMAVMLVATVAVTMASVTHARTITARVPNLAVLTVSQASSSDTPIVTVNITQDAGIDNFGIYQFQDSTCTNNGGIFDPNGVSAGQLSDRYGSFNASLVTMDPELTLFGTHTIISRSFVVRNGSQVLGCAPIGFPASCSPTEYIVSPQTATDAIVCATLTFCNGLVQYETVAATATSDRSCSSFATNDAAAVVIKGLSKSGFFNVEREARATLQEVLSTATGKDLSVSILRRVFSNGTDTDTPDSETFLQIWIAAADTATRTPLSQSQVRDALQQLSGQTPASCQTAVQAACTCNTTATVPNVTLAADGCFSYAGSSYCVPDDASCPNSFPATTVDANAFKNTGLRFRTCPTAHVPTTCLEVAMNTEVIGVTLPSEITVDSIEIPDIRVPPQIVENLTLSQIGVEKLREGARWWRNLIQPTTLPYDDINYQIQYSRENGGMDASRAQTDGISYALPFAIMVGVSLLFFVFLPIVMGIVACCRCCSCCCCHKCCGGKMDQEDPSQTKCLIYTLLTLAAAVCLIAFASLVIAADAQMKDGVDDVEAAAIKAMDNMDLFKNNTLTQASDVPGVLFPVVLDGVIGLLDTLNAGVAFGVVDVITEGSDVLLSVVRDLADQVDSNYFSLIAVRDLSPNITAKLQEMETKLQALDTEHENTRTACYAKNDSDIDVICDSFLPSIPTDVPSFSVNPVINPIIDGLQSIRDSDLRGLADEAEGIMNDIPNDVQTEIDSATTTINTEANNAQRELEDEIETIRSNADQFVYQDFDIRQQKENVASNFESAEPYEEYSAQTAKAIAGVFISLGALVIIATLVGACMYDNDLDPTLRSEASNCMGRLLLGSVGTMVIFTTILHLVIAILFLIAAITGKMCDSTTNDEVFSEVVDQPANWGGKYPLASALYPEDKQNLRLAVTDVLNACRNNTAIFSAFKLDNAFDLAELTNFTSQINVREQLGTVSFTDIDVIPDEILDDVLAYNDLGIQDIDVSEYTDQLTDLQNTLGAVTTSVFEGYVAAFQAYPGSTDVSDLISMSQDLDARADEIDMIRAEVTALQQQQIDALADVVMSVQNLTVRVEEFARDLQAFEVFFLEVAESAFDVDAIANDVLELADRFVGIASDIIRDDIAPCGLMTQSYDDMMSATCGETQKGLDAWWFSLALLSLMSLIITITGIKLARYFRRMTDLAAPVAKSKNSIRSPAKHKRPMSDGYRHFADDSISPPPRKEAFELDEHDTATERSVLTADDDDVAPPLSPYDDGGSPPPYFEENPRHYDDDVDSIDMRMHSYEEERF